MASGVVVVGSITVDVTAIAPRLPRPGETVLGDDVSLALGGKGANQAIAAAHFGAPTSIVGCVGSDAFADIATTGLAEHGVGTNLVRANTGRTGIAHIRVDARGDNDIVIIPLANSELTRYDVDRAIETLDGHASVMLVQLEVPADITAYAARAGADAGFTVVFDPAPAAAVPDDIWGNVHVVTPNESEASAITGIEVADVPSARRAAKWFLDRGVDHVIVTLGKVGAVHASRDDARLFAAMEVDAVDSTAAGDAFTGTVAAALAMATSMREAIGRGMVAGALATTKIGASTSLPQRAEIDACDTVRSSPLSSG